MAKGEGGREGGREERVVKCWRDVGWTGQEGRDGGKVKDVGER